MSETNPPPPRSGPGDSDRSQAASKDSGAGAYSSLMRLAMAGSQLAGTVGLFMLLGWWLDRRWGTAPWLLVSLGVLAVAGGLYHFVKDALR